jgi:hypothetical protein
MNDSLTKLLLTEEEAAEVLGIQPFTLAKYRRSGDGPPFVKISRGDKRLTVRYRKKELLEWIEGRITK